MRDSDIKHIPAVIRDDIRKILENHSGEILLTLFLSTQCSNCPVVMRQIAPLPLVNPAIRLRVIDALLFPDQASEHHTFRLFPL